MKFLLGREIEKGKRKRTTTTSSFFEINRKETKRKFDSKEGREVDWLVRKGQKE